MIEIASQANITKVDVVDNIIRELNDRSTEVGVLKGSETIEELKKKLKRYEKSKRKQNEMYANQMSATSQMLTAGNLTTGNIPRRYTAVRNSITVEINLEFNIRCWNFSRYGHYQSTCLEQKRNKEGCFICNKIGHFHQKCP